MCFFFEIFIVQYLGCFFGVCTNGKRLVFFDEPFYLGGLMVLMVSMGMHVDVIV